MKRPCACTDGTCFWCVQYRTDPEYRRYWDAFERRRWLPAHWRTFARALWRHLLDWCRSASRPEQARRKAHCQACEHWQEANDSCRLCGCALWLKRRWKSERCPLNPPKW